MADPLERRATNFVGHVHRWVALWRWGSPERVLALLGFASLAAAPFVARLLPERLPAILQPLKPWVSVPLWLVGGVCLGLAALRIYRRVTAPLPPEETKLPALKGAASFTDAEDDAELFTRLGRGAELEQLRAWILDDQKPLVVLMGESGVGKTSLLRAGLTHVLKKKDGIEVIYWEALPTNPANGLLHAIRTAWGKAKGTPTDLAALPAAVATSPRVVVLDQFEQLSPEAHPAVFELLRDVLLNPPPYRGTWIVAFRRDYSATWVDFTLGLPEPVRHRVETLSLTRFSLPAARRVVTELAAAAALPVAQKVVDTLVDGIAVDGRVSPVDIGVTLLGLGELAGPDGTPSLSLDDFRASGGPAGLLTRYLERQLAFFSPTERSELLAALLALADLGRNQRLAEGLSPAELAGKVRPVSPARFDQALRFLASGKARVLEILTDQAEAPRYRLLHERFVEPLRLLSGTLLAKAAQAALRLDEAFRIWSRNRRRRFLLSGSDLRLVLRYQEQFLWDQDAAEKRDFLRRSRLRRMSLRALAAASCLGLLGLGAAVRNWQDKRELAVELRSWGLPEDLGDSLGQLETLEIGPTVKRLDWLSRVSRLRSLYVHAQLDAPTALPPNLEELTCSSCLNVHLLDLPSHLRKLALTLHSNGTGLPILPASLMSLDLPLLDIPFSLSDLPRGLTSLSFQIQRGSSLKGSSLTSFPPGLKSLTLQGDAFWAPQLPSGLIELKVGNFPMTQVPRSVTSLTLSNANDYLSFDGAPPTLSSLALTYTQSDFPSLDLQGLPRKLASLAIEDSRPNRGSPGTLDLRDFHNLTDLSLGSARFSIVQVPNTLRSLGVDTSLLSVIQLPPGIEQLSLTGGELSDLKGLPRALRSLKLSGVLLHSWEGLPLSLQSLSLILVRVDPPMNLELPPNLQSLVLVDSQLSITTLPPHLVSLVIKEPWQGLEGRLPSTLRSLEVSWMSGTLKRLDDLGDLPPHLEELTLPAAVNSLRGLPQSVRVLRLR